MAEILPVPGGGIDAPAELETLVLPRSSDLGDGFTVRRALPSAQRRMVGPYVFFDEMGPVALAPGKGLDVRPHPHIGLATVTYLFEGEILHRDSLGTVQPIRAGEVNWMTAGRGIAHSERTPPALREGGGRLAGVQVWVALPQAHEETKPAFAHHEGTTLPLLQDSGATVRLVIGEWAGARSPVRTFSEMLYADAALAPGARLQLPGALSERAAYLVSGAVQVGGQRFEPGRLLVFAPGREVVLHAAELPVRLVLFGGEPLEGPRYVWWNFVSSSRERIEQAKADWQAGRFVPVPDEHEFIPLPEQPATVANYP